VNKIKHTSASQTGKPNYPMGPVEKWSLGVPGGAANQGEEGLEKSTHTSRHAKNRVIVGVILEIDNFDITA